MVAETALARIVPREALGRVIGTSFAVSRAAIIAGAVLVSVLVESTSLRARLLVLGAAALAITLLCRLGLRGLDALNAQRADALASRVKVLHGLPVTAGVPQIVFEQLAAAAQFCPLPPGDRRGCPGGCGACLLRRRGWPRVVVLVMALVAAGVYRSRRGAIWPRRSRGGRYGYGTGDGPRDW